MERDLTTSPTFQDLRLRENARRFIARTQGTRWDWINPLCMVALMITGVFFIYSAKKYVQGDDWIKQLFYIGLGGGVYFTISLFHPNTWMRNAHWIYLACLIPLLMLVITKYTGLPLLGHEAEGAWRWLKVGPFTFQPSEGAKLGVLVMVSSILARSQVGTVRESLFVLFKVALTVLVPIILIFLQPDLGSSLVFPPMVFALLYISKLSERFFLAVFGVFVALMAVVAIDVQGYYSFYTQNDLDFDRDKGAYEAHGILPLHDYQRSRLLGFIMPEAVDPRGIGISWNQRQALQAVGTGGITGKGLGQGDQAQLGYLPRSVAHNDFIFAVLAEEKGFLGGMFVIGIYATLLFNSIRMAGNAPDRFGRLLIVGVSVIFAIHVFINIGMNIGLMPITGLPLPFLSYGGSFILTCCILQGLVQSVYRHRREILT